MNSRDDAQRHLDPHDMPTIDLGDPENQGLDLHDDDPLPDLPAAAADSEPISSADPVDFSTRGWTAAGAVGMSTFNDGDDQSLFERATDAFEENRVADGRVDEELRSQEAPQQGDAVPRSGVRIYDRSS